MNKIINLKDLLKHEILDLYSAEEQISENLPDMIENATGASLKSALDNYQAQSNLHKDSLEKLKVAIREEGSPQKDRSFFSNLFGGSNIVTSKGIDGLFKEWDKLMGEDLTPEARDAAIIGSVQKIGHYKIAGYGTVKAYAKELKMDFAVAELAKCLDNEYNSDQSFTQLAVGSVNTRAENAVINEDDQKQALKDDLNLLGNSVSIMNSSDSEDE